MANARDPTAREKQAFSRQFLTLGWSNAMVVECAECSLALIPNSRSVTGFSYEATAQLETTATGGGGGEGGDGEGGGGRGEAGSISQPGLQ